jgi:hypothetical protein
VREKLEENVAILSPSLAADTADANDNAHNLTASTGS